MQLPSSRYPDGCEFKVELPRTRDGSGVSHGARATIACGWRCDDSADQGEIVLIQGRGEPEDYVLTSPSDGLSGPSWVSLSLANTLPNREGVEAFVRHFGLPEMPEDEFYAHSNFLQDVLFFLILDGWTAVKERFPSVLKHAGRLREPRNVVEFAYRELEHLHGRIGKCSWERCRLWYVRDKQASHQRFCALECNKEWHKAATRKNGPPLLSVAADCIQRGRLADGKAILNRYIQENGGPEEFEKSLAKVGVVLQPGTLMRSVRQNKRPDLLHIACGLMALRSG
jgi:hypothetical protein